MQTHHTLIGVTFLAAAGTLGFFLYRREMEERERRQKGIRKYLPLPKQPTHMEKALQASKDAVRQTEKQLHKARKQAEEHLSRAKRDAEKGIFA